MGNEKIQRYCIIGAGFCGLGIVKTFRDYRISFDCFEKNTVLGGNWFQGVHDSTHLISSRDATQYLDYPMPSHYPVFPSRKQVLDYLNSFADHFNLRPSIQFSTEVVKVTPLDPSGMSGWKVQLSTGETRTYKGVIVANGHHWDKRYPSYPGTYSGKSLHSKDYRNLSDLSGNRILVVGGGNSACDIAVEAALAGLESSISMRRGYYFLPKTLLGVPLVDIDRPWLPVFIQKWLIKLLLRLTQGKNSNYGLQKPDHDLYDHHPTVNSQLLYFIQHGRIQPKRDIARLEGKTVFFTDGSQKEIDTIVWATGFNVSFPFLDRHLYEWDHGYPKQVMGMLNPHLAGIYLFGFTQPRGGAGPLISLGTQLLADLVLAQEKADHPISKDLARIKGPDARALKGISELKREIFLARNIIKFYRFARRGREESFSTSP